MRVLQDYKQRHWLFCFETGKMIHINTTGARKVASVCDIEIEKFKTKEDFDLEIKYLKEKYGL